MGLKPLRSEADIRKYVEQKECRLVKTSDKMLWIETAAGRRASVLHSNDLDGTFNAWTQVHETLLELQRQEQGGH